MYKSIFIIEDEVKIAQLIQDYLRPIFQEIKIISHSKDVMPAIQHSPPDFIILDIMLPGKDGFEVLRDIRKQYFLPVLMLTAKAEETDRIMGLEFGADDYVTKPFSPKELVARVKAIMRRIYPDNSAAKNVYEHQKMRINTESHEVWVEEQKILFTPTEFSILLLLIRRPNIVFERSTIMNQVLGYEYEGYERTIDAHIKNIRRKIAAVSEEKYIESIYGLGYKLSS